MTRVSRREALRWFGASGIALGVATCSPAPTQAPAPTQVQAPTQAPAPTPRPTSAPSAIKRGGTLMVGADVNPVGLDPALTTAFSSVAIYEQLYSSLLTLDYSSNKVKPDLATSWTQIDPNTVELKLRQGVKFHSGRELTGDDVKYTWDRLLNPKLTVPLNNYLGPGAAVEVVDKYTVHLKNNPVYAPLLSIIADRRPTAIVDRDAVEKNGDLQNADAGSGPFKLVEYTPDVRVILEKNGDYYEKDLPILERIEFRIIPDEQARIAAIRAGEVDLTVLKDPKSARLLRDQQDIVLNDVPSFWRSTPIINEQHKPLDDVRVRQALSYATDRQEIINTVLLGEGVPTGPIPPGETEWAIPLTPDNFPTYQYNPDKARQLLKEAGAEGLKIGIQAAPAYAPDIPTSQVLQSQWKKVGIDLQLQQMEWAAVLKAQQDATFDLNITFNTNRPDPDTYLSVGHSKFVQNWGKYSNPKMDELIEKGRSTTDLATRKQVYADVQRLFATEVPSLYLYVIKNYEPARAYVRGYVPMASGYRLSLKETWLDK